MIAHPGTPSAIGVVISQDGDNYAINCILEGVAGGSMPGAVTVAVLTPGPRDGLRVEQHPLPTVGTRGLILFPRADFRSPVWIGSLPGPLNDALTGAPGIENVAWSSRFSGWSHFQDEAGQEQITWPDGSTLTVGSPASPTRHIVTAGQQRQRVPFPHAERVSLAPSPFPFVLQLASGASIECSTTGAVTITAGSGQTITLRGNTNVIGALTATGNVTAGQGGADQVGLQTHDHQVQNVQTGSSTITTTPPIAGT